jgi:carbon monoxide dehydrogenase subunit G
MPVLKERLHTNLPIERAFDFVADFANASAWDPGTATSERIDAGPVETGARYRLGVRMGGSIRPMEYVITAYERPRRVVLAGEGSGVSATDTITFEPEAEGTRIDYSADIRLGGLLRLVAPIAGGQFAKIASQARDGMQRTLDQMAERPA